MDNTSPKVISFCEADLPLIAPVHLTAFKGYMNAAMGKAYVKAFLKWFLNYPGAITLKAEIDNTICGYVVGAPIGYDRHLNKDLFLTAIKGVLTHPSILLHPNFRRAVQIKISVLFGKRPAQMVVKNPLGRGVSLVGIAVHPNFAGRKAGRLLIHEFERQARAQNMNYMRLSVYESNSRAREVYEKSGWKELSRSESVIYYYKELIPV